MAEMAKPHRFGYLNRAQDVVVPLAKANDVHRNRAIQTTKGDPPGSSRYRRQSRGPVIGL
jgi:hypothetical protein